jgi:hypothetical protein
MVEFTAAIRERLGAPCCDLLTKRIERERTAPPEEKPQTTKKARRSIGKISTAAHVLALALREPGNVCALTLTDARRELPEWFPIPDERLAAASERLARMADDLVALEELADETLHTIPATAGERPDPRRPALVRDIAVILAKRGHDVSKGGTSRPLLLGIVSTAWAYLGLGGEPDKHLRTTIRQEGWIDDETLRLFARGAAKAAPS